MSLDTPLATRPSRRDKAQKVVEGMGVKLHRFLPSGTCIWTVVGSESDFLVDPAMAGRKAYCSCDDFYFRVSSGKVAECYHLIALKRAMQEGMYSVTEFSDEEMRGFLEALVSDMFANVA